MIKRHADDVTIDYIIRLRKLEQENERLREALQHIKSLATPPVRQKELRAILEECVWLVNAALKETE